MGAQDKHRVARQKAIRRLPYSSNELTDCRVSTVLPVQVLTVRVAITGGRYKRSKRVCEASV